MCGIAGVVSLNSDPLPAELPFEKMSQALAHRGPDDQGVYQESRVVLAHRRLSIIDLSANGRQPILSPCGNVVLTFNGQIYNFQILKKELENLGHRFKSKSDSEVLAAALSQWGVAALDRLDGMFAFGAWFKDKKRLLLARDRTGIKPLVYQIQGNQLFFASEITALKPLWKQKPNINLEGLHHYLAFGHVSDTKTLLQGIHRLPAAHYLWADEGIPKVYWQLKFNQEYDPSTVKDQVYHLIEKSVISHVISDRPVSLMLSGGLDSSILSHFIGRLPDKKVRAYTVEYPAQGDDVDFNEYSYAKQTADMHGIDLEKLVITEDEIYREFENLGHFMDEPNGGPALLPLFCGYKKLKDTTTVVVDGGGADECFGGYRKYLVGQAWEATKNLPRPLKRILNSFGVYGGTGGKWLNDSSTVDVIDQQLMYRLKELAQILGSSYDKNFRQKTIESFGVSSQLPFATQMQCVDIKNHMIGWGNSLLDRVSMAWGVECRVPYQDHHLLEYVMNLPTHLRIKWPREKALLKSVFKNHVPSGILNRKKNGFGSPTKHYLRFGLKEAMCDLLSPSRLKAQGLFDVQTVQKMIKETLDITANHTPKLWALLQFQMWKDNVLEGSHQ